MSRQNKHNSNEGKLPVILIGFALFALLYILLEEDGKDRSEASQTFEELSFKDRPYSLDRVNEHILITKDSMEFDRIRTQAELYKATAGKAVPQKNVRHESVLNLDYDRSNEAVAEDLGRVNSQETLPSTPHELIQKQIYQKEKRAQDLEDFYAQKRAAIIQNARAKGYEIQVDAKGEKILKWKKIKRSSASENLSQSAGGTAR